MKVTGWDGNGPLGDGMSSCLRRDKSSRFRAAAASGKMDEDSGEAVERPRKSPGQQSAGLPGDCRKKPLALLPVNEESKRGGRRDSLLLILIWLRLDLTSTTSREEEEA